MSAGMGVLSNEKDGKPDCRTRGTPSKDTAIVDHLVIGIVEGKVDNIERVGGLGRGGGRWEGRGNIQPDSPITKFCRNS